MSETPEVAASPQPVQALRKANHVRRARAILKTKIADGETTAGQIILTCPAEVARMPIAQLLATQRGWGDARCRAFLAEISMGENKPIGSLTERQRRTIASLLSDTTARTPAR
jgi:hypothetical protein